MKITKVAGIRVILETKPDWSDSEIARIFECSRELVNAVRTGRYNPPQEEVKPKSLKKYQCGICQHPLTQEECEAVAQGKSTSVCHSCSSVFASLRACHNRVQKQGIEIVRKEIERLIIGIVLRRVVADLPDASAWMRAKEVAKRLGMVK